MGLLTSAPWRLLLVEPDVASGARLKLALRRLREAPPDIDHVLGASAAEQRLHSQRYDACLIAADACEVPWGGRPDGALGRLAALAPEMPLLMLLAQSPPVAGIPALLDQASGFVLKDDLAPGTLAAALEVAIRQHRLESRLRMLLDASPDAMLVLDAERRVLYSNATAGELYATAPAELLDRTLDLPDPLPDHGELSIGARTLEARCASIEWLRRPATLLTLRDVTARKSTELDLAFRAEHDPLTGLVNGARLHHELRSALARAGRDGGRVAVFYLDLDGFKAINDLYGHETGDTLLHQIAARLAGTCREGEVIGRLGGDEFAAIAENVPEGAEVHIAQRLLAATDKPLYAGARAVQVSMSIGIATAPDDGSDVASLLRAADTAMYTAKSAGRNTFRRAGEAELAAQRRMALIADLRRAVVQREFEVLYLPFVDLATGGIVGAEALLRWRREPDVLEAPAAFLEAAEESGLIVALGDLVAEALCAQWVRWRWTTGKELNLGLNISSRELRAPEFGVRLRRTLGAHGVPAHCLSLEVAEDVLARDIQHTLAVTDTLHGLNFAVDGMAGDGLSLRSLGRLPVRALKLSRWLVQADTTDHAAHTLAKGLVAFARAVGLRVIAEGVETPEQAAHVTSLGCEWAQGFHYSRGLAADAFLQLLTAGPEAERTLPPPLH